MAHWRSNDPAQDEATIKRIAKLAIGFADANELPPGVLYGEGPDDPSGLIPLLTAVFYIGRACGARAAISVLTDTPIPESAPEKPVVIREEGPQWLN